ncbi:hypothetical protein GCM10009665_34640 [Kitasatospora nipponensis]|uniref:M23ase beta-sheet core domain-containing protein n=1 Tax=Kitasatospora nipponensis TaxID=258049 RepID=A0ABP4GW61_9ACTN
MSTGEREMAQRRVEDIEDIEDVGGVQERERAALHAYLTPPHLDPALFAPGFVQNVGADFLAALRERVVARHGEVRELLPGGAASRHRVRCARGEFSALVNVDGQGRIVFLWLAPEGSDADPDADADADADAGPESASVRTLRERLAGPVLAPLVGALAGPALALNAALTGTRTEAGLSLLAALALLPVSRLRVPWEWVGRWVRAAGTALVLVPAGWAALRWPALPAGGIPPVGAAVTAVVVLSALAVVRGVREEGGRRPVLLITNPLPGSRALVVQGGGRSVNHHVGVPAQRIALDVVCLGRRGRRSARGPMPRDLAAYHAYGSTLVAPCDGTVIGSADGFHDQPVQVAPGERRALRPQPATGNHVILRTSTADGEVLVVLAHLRRGSVRVRVGDRVTAGQPLALIGNSGNTTEPHLHIHAERRTAASPVGIPLRLVARPGRRLRRGRRLDL